MPFDFDAWSREVSPPNLDSPLEDCGLDVDDLDKVSGLLYQWADYVKLRSNQARQVARGNLAVADLIQRDMDKLYGEIPGWGRWERKSEDERKTI